jgi:hypothetical protein
MTVSRDALFITPALPFLLKRSSAASTSVTETPLRTAWGQAFPYYPHPVQTTISPRRSPACSWCTVLETSTARPAAVQLPAGIEDHA